MNLNCMGGMLCRETTARSKRAAFRGRTSPAFFRLRRRASGTRRQRGGRCVAARGMGIVMSWGSRRRRRAGCDSEGRAFGGAADKEASAGRPGCGAGVKSRGCAGRRSGRDSVRKETSPRAGESERRQESAVGHRARGARPKSNCKQSVRTRAGGEDTEGRCDGQRARGVRLPSERSIFAAERRDRAAVFARRRTRRATPGSARGNSRGRARRAARFRSRARAVPRAARALEPSAVGRSVV